MAGCRENQRTDRQTETPSILVILTHCSTITLFVTEVIIDFPSRSCQVLYVFTSHFSPKPPTGNCESHDNIVSIFIESIYIHIFIFLTESLSLLIIYYYIINIIQVNQSVLVLSTL